ncbi:MAG: hypothetical protein J5760_05930 [Clostridia bacterium]|nr:hypothetical protein [Clostridia bacterium]
MRSKLNTLDIIMILVAFALCFLAVTLFIRDLYDTKSVTLKVAVSDELYGLLKRGDEVELNGLSGEIVSFEEGTFIFEDGTYGKAAVIAFGGAGSNDLPKIGEKTTFTTKTVSADGIVTDKTETEEETK